MNELEQEDVNVELRGNELHVSGERRSEEERSEGGYYRSERSYGSFYRVVALPEGAKPDTASATFENGVLEIEVCCLRQTTDRPFASCAAQRMHGNSLNR